MHVDNLLSYFFLNFDMIANYQKSCKNNLKNSYVLFIQNLLMLAFYCMSFVFLSYSWITFLQTV